MRIIEILKAECIASGVELSSKEQALGQVVSVAKRHPALADVSDDVILDALKERESLGSTGFGDGVAIPHCRLEGISEFIIGIITVPAGVEFDALDGKDVKLMIFIIAPAEKSNDHIKLLSAVSQTLMIPGAVKEIIAGHSDEAVRESFLRHTRDEIDTKEQVGKNLFTVTIQDETIFREMISTLAGIDSNSVSIIEAENAGSYLSKMPLFADFWSDKKHPFCKVILATVEKGLTNETLRRIEALTGCLNDRDDVMVTIQELSYWAGSIQV
jgi:PTS system nitrogen regulatory IIA component